MYFTNFFKRKKKIYVNVELEFGKLNKYRINFCEIIKEPEWLLNGFSHNWLFDNYTTALYNAVYQGLKFNYKTDEK